MINALIIDDEQHCIDRLKNLVQEQFKHSVHIVGTCQSVDEGLTAIRELKPNLVFLDVQINGQTGFDLLKELGTLPFDLIFTTAYEQYAVQAFKFSAIDYLLKPIDPDDLLLAVERLKEKISKDEMAKKLETLFNNLDKKTHKKIIVPTIQGLNFIEITDIIRCQSDINYTTLFLKDKQQLVVAKTLKEFEELLGDYNFFRVHNSHLINLDYIKSYNKGKGGYVSMLDHSEIEVSSRRKNDFMKKLAEI